MINQKLKKGGKKKNLKAQTLKINNTINTTNPISKLYFSESKE